VQGAAQSRNITLGGGSQATAFAAEEPKPTCTSFAGVWLA